MSGFSARDAIFLNEMGLGPLWRLRAVAAGVVPDGDVAVLDTGAVDDAEQGAPLAANVATVAERGATEMAPAAGTTPAPAVERGAAQVPPAALAPAAARGAADAAPPSGPRPLQPVAQTVSALGPDNDSAWDDVQGPEATLEEIAQMDWDGLALAIASCRRCGACRDGRSPVSGTGAKTARWVVAAGASTAADDKARLPLAGDPGKLLDNMLAAVGMDRTRDVWITNLVKCRPATANGGERAPTAEEAAACRPFLEREVALTGAGTVLTLGQIAANTLLGRALPSPLAGARGDVHAIGIGGAAVNLVATLHPGELLRRGADKALAWADLCRARTAPPASADDGSVGDVPV